MRSWICLLFVEAALFAALPSAAATRTILHEGWTLQSSCKVKDSGSTISSLGYRTDGWIGATVPTTVLAAEVTAGMYKDIFFGTNLRSIPGATYSVATNFSNLPMPAESP